MLMRFHFGLGVGHAYSHHRLTQPELHPEGSTAHAAFTHDVEDPGEIDGVGGEEDSEDDDEDDGTESGSDIEQRFGSSDESLLDQFDEIRYGIANFQFGSLTLLQKPFCFVGYLAVGSRPILYALYCSAIRLEALKLHVEVIAYVLPLTPHNSIWESCVEVPIFVAKAHNAPDAPPVNLDLNAIWSRPSNDGVLLHVYAWGNGHNTIIVDAIFPSGHDHEAYPEFDDAVLAELSELLGSLHEGSVVPDTSLASSAMPDSSLASSVVPDSRGLSSIAHSHNDDQPNNTPTRSDSESLNDIQLKYPQWQTVLVRLRILMRLDICCGACGNPFLLTHISGAEHKARFVANLFERSLAELRLTRAELCSIRATDGSEVTVEDILVLAAKWVSALLSDTKRLAKIAILDPRPPLGFSIIDLPLEILIERCVVLLHRFLLPNSGRLPIADNGLAWFLMKEIAKSLVYHLVFWRSVSATVPVVLADIAPGIFRNAPHPPMETLAFVGASCYGSILQRLGEILKAMSKAGKSTTVNVSQYPPVSQVYDELLQTVVLLFAQKDDPGYPAFVNRMAQLCNITTVPTCPSQIKEHSARYMHQSPPYYIKSLTNTTGFFSLPNKELPLQLHSHRYSRLFNDSSLGDRCRKPSCINSALPHIPTTPSTKHILEIEHAENALKSWLRKRGREILPDSLFVTISVLFAWVDPLDLIAVIQVSLRVVAMEKLFQQPELTCISFLLQGGRCYMEERMYRAQMEVTLFSKAIANLCEEFGIRCRPSLVPLPEQHTGYISACQMPPPPDEFEGFQLPTAAHVKCQKWLSMSSEFIVDFPQIQEVPQLYENLLRLNGQFLSLPFLMKSWVGSVTYRAYISAFCADCADTKLLGINIDNSPKSEKEKPLDVLKSDLHILELKKHRAQAEVEMFSEAIARTAGPRSEDGHLYYPYRRFYCFDYRLWDSRVKGQNIGPASIQDDPATSSPTMRKCQRTDLNLVNPVVADPQQPHQHLPQPVQQTGVPEDGFIHDQDAAESGGDDDEEEEKPKSDKKGGRRKIKIENETSHNIL
ncbi:hypothetical protein DEU56DRAFT_755604 [Suillus clintonianus]|uniref:uncharacterized protein n=1 Tax=Suillus clintonianus TaxID=1904413 RepID=UPI001B87FB3B|nr:uncharacterized protein DEU56DRAFT_755604 [Suillus clintonianus]KAG2139299.1 hypothetical protein DEU56DRAFT_755604 [Suillus clintonianus]